MDWPMAFTIVGVAFAIVAFVFVLVWGALKV